MHGKWVLYILSLSGEKVGQKKQKKTDCIRDMLLKTVGKNPDLFCYYVSIQEAKELLLKKPKSCQIKEEKEIKPVRKLGEG